MTFQEKKKEPYEQIAQLEEEIVILKRNIKEFKKILWFLTIVYITYITYIYCN